VSGTGSERYWDERARENALYYVDTQVGYDDPDTEVFWTNGETVVTNMFDMVGFAPRPTDTVLDIGCGVGRLTRALAHRVAHVYGLDVSSEMLRLAQDHNRELENVDWLHGDGEGLGVLEDGSVDGCFSHVVFQHIPDPEVTLNYVREIGRVLRPDGWTLFQVSTDPELHRPKLGRRDRLRALVGRSSAGDAPREWWGAHVDLDSLREAVAAGGMTLDRLVHEGSQFTTVLARR
jgi:SAM-dependent methyltransferase